MSRPEGLKERLSGSGEFYFAVVLILSVIGWFVAGCPTF